MLVKKNIAPLLPLAFLSTFVSTVNAAPEISSVEGSLSHSSTLTLKGKGFTQGGSPIIWDTTDNQPYSDKLSHGEAIPTTEGIWTQNGNPWSTPITINKKGDVRSKHRQSVYSGKTKSYLGWPRLTDGKGHPTLYVSWWFKPDNSVSNAGGSNKVIRIWDDSNGKNTRISWTVDHMTADTESYSSGSSWKMWGGQTNQWNRLEIWVDANKNTIKSWTNGKLIHNYDNFKKSSTTDESLTIGLIGFDPSISENYSGTTFSLADIYASRSISRVELSSSPTWSTTAPVLKEIQPSMSWTDNEIKIKLNAGNLIPEKAYLYVVDDTGTANSQGYPICLNCPEAPKLSIE